MRAAGCDGDVPGRCRCDAVVAARPERSSCSVTDGAPHHRETSIPARHRSGRFTAETATALRSVARTGDGADRLTAPVFESGAGVREFECRRQLWSQLRYVADRLSETGGVPERFNGSVLKTDDGATRPWVRIPPPPPLRIVRRRCTLDIQRRDRTQGVAPCGRGRASFAARFLRTSPTASR